MIAKNFKFSARMQYTKYDNVDVPNRLTFQNKPTFITLENKNKQCFFNNENKYLQLAPQEK